MTDDGKRDRKALTRRPDGRTYDVGYGKPPVQTRFKPGQSGNPGGRRKGSKNRLPALNEERLKTIVIEEAYRMVSISDAKGEIRIPIAQAVIRSLAVNAAKGNQRAQRLFAELLSATERENRRHHDEWLEAAIEYKVEWERELHRRQEFGIVAPDPIPHPDDIVIDMQTGRVRIIGPMTREEKVQWDQWRARKRDAEEAIAEHERELRANPNHPHRRVILEEIEHEKKMRAILSRVIRD